MAAKVTVVDHPLVQHKLTLMRDVTRSTKGFRELLNEIGMLLAYEVTRDLPLEPLVIETPLQTMEGQQIAGKKLVLAPILRAGVGFLDGMLSLMPAARVARCWCSIPCSPRRTRQSPRSSASRAAVPAIFASSVCSPRRKASRICSKRIRTCRSGRLRSIAI